MLQQLHFNPPTANGLGSATSASLDGAVLSEGDDVQVNSQFGCKLGISLSEHVIFKVVLLAGV